MLVSLAKNLNFGLRRLFVQGLARNDWTLAAGEAMLILDNQNKMTKFSSSALPILSIPYEKLSGKSIFDLVSQGDKSQLAEALNYVRREQQNRGANQPAFVKRLPLNIIFGEDKSLRFMAHIQGSSSDRSRGRVMILLYEDAARIEQDHTEISPACEGERVSSSGFLSLSSEKIGDLSHEMKTPLTAILGFADAMREEIFGPLGHDRYREYAQHIHRSGDHLIGLVSSLLDLARLDADQYGLKPVLDNLGDVTQECAEMMRGEVEKAGLNLVVERDAEMKDSLFDPQAVRQIVINLLSNAAKFTSDGTISVQITREDEQMVVRVRDTGIGMSGAQLQALGERFTTAQSDGVRGARGNGIGLSLAAALANYHGGGLIIDSAPGEGSLATLRLPFIELVHSEDMLDVDLEQTQILSGQRSDQKSKTHMVDPQRDEAGLYVGGRNFALSTQMERIDDFRKRVISKRDDADAA